MDRYECKWVAWVYGRPWAITLGQTTYYTEKEQDVGVRWRRHEDKHKEQWRREGRLFYCIKYLYYTIRHGYWDNPYEVEARHAAGSIP